MTSFDEVKKLCKEMKGEYAENVSVITGEIDSNVCKIGKAELHGTKYTPASVSGKRLDLFQGNLDFIFQLDKVSTHLAPKHEHSVAYLKGGEGDLFEGKLGTYTEAVITPKGIQKVEVRNVREHTEDILLTVYPKGD